MDDVRLSVLDVGLLAMALRAPDGADFTVAGMARKRRPGREALTKAMRNLVACGYIVKLKIQDAATGTWRTEFSVADLPFSREDVDGMLGFVTGARAVRVEPAWLDPRAAAASNPGAESAAPAVPDRVTGSRQSVVTSRNIVDPQVGPTDGFPAVGEPTVGDPSAKEQRLHVQDGRDSLSSPPDDPALTAEREGAPPGGPSLIAVPGPLLLPSRSGESLHDLGSLGRPVLVNARAAGIRVADAWAEARRRRGHPVPVLGHRRLARVAAALAAAGSAEEVLAQAAVDMAREPAWLDLERHLEHWSPPSPRPAPTGSVPFCGSCDYGWVTGDDDRVRKCPCRSGGAP
ncbi:hypothetical protein ABZ883_35390 [Streptomyces sp. NPDC046977]|uniref:hypothetical protein n=1 Tax=Streptomyces sp. NPDC046977 TaxID=3154703 RepID=UPI0033DF8554